MAATNGSIKEAAVAIVMRTKDRPLLLPRALSDVTHQVFQDWHLYVVNDAGDPKTVDHLLEEHAEALAGRVTVIHNSTSRGMEAASNQAIHASSSPYIAIHDDDDTWHPEFLLRALAHLDGTSDAAVGVRTEIVWESVVGGEVIEVEREIFLPDIHEVTLFQLLRHNRMVPISVLYRRSVHDEIGYYQEDLPAVGDWQFYLRLAVSHRIGFLDGEPFAFWHQRREEGGSLGNSVILRADDHRRFDLLVRDEALREHVRQNGLGGLLYMTRFVDTEIGHLHGRVIHNGEEILRLMREQNDRIGALEAAISDASMVSLLRRRYRRLKGRLLAHRR